MKKVLVSGCYDILHGGHVEFFLQAKGLGDYLIVSVASDEVLWEHKHRKSSVPLQHKVNLLKSLAMVNEVVVGRNLELGLDFKDEFLRIKPDVLAVTEDDRYGDKKRELCKLTGTQYVALPKTLDYEKISTTQIVSWIRAPFEVPLRIDFAGGWLDVPKFAMEGGYIVNCAISPLVSIHTWPYEIGSGLGGSGAYAILSGSDAVRSELKMGVGWQDPAVIHETGLCVWRSGQRPVLDMKVNPDFLAGKLALLWTGKSHVCNDLVDLKRDYKLIFEAGLVARRAVIRRSVKLLEDAVRISYEMQRGEGMQPLPELGESAKKYCGGGHGGYAVYLFRKARPADKDLKPVEPYLEMPR